jgi:hypothetical protein
MHHALFACAHLLFSITLVSMEDTPALKAATASLYQRQSKLGRPLNHSEFLAVFDEHQQQLSRDDRRQLLNTWGDTQAPPIARDKLLDVIAAQSARLHTYQATSVFREWRGDVTTPTRIEKIIERRAPGCYYLETVELSTVNELPVRSTIRSTADHVNRSYDDNTKVGSINSSTTLSQDPSMQGILANAMHMSRAKGASHLSYSLEAMLARDDCILLHDPVNIDGTDHLVVVQGPFRVFLSLKHQYAVRRFETIHNLTSRDQQGRPKRGLLNP